MSNRSHIDALKAAADPARVVPELGLRGRGGRFFCPLCQTERGSNPALSVGREGFRCFKCDEHGDLLNLIMVAADTDFPGAVRWLENLTGIHPAPRRKGSRGDKERLRPGRVRAGWTRRSGGEEPGPADPAVLDAFLEGCRPVANSAPDTEEGKTRAWLKSKVPRMTDIQMEALGLRFCGREYPEVMDGLKRDFGEDALLAAGLLKRSRSGRAVPSFWHYYNNNAGFLVVPYLVDSRAVYLKVRPPVSRAEAESRGLVRFMNTAAAVPALYNRDVLAQRPCFEAVLVCEGESDTWTALSCGRAAVGVPGAGSFKREWVEDFRPFVDSAGRSRVFLALDADTAGTKGARSVANLFRQAGLPVPRSLPVPAGTDLSEYLNEGRNE